MKDPTDQRIADDAGPLLDVYGDPDEPDPEWDKGIAEKSQRLTFPIGPTTDVR